MLRNQTQNFSMNHGTSIHNPSNDKSYINLIKNENNQFIDSITPIQKQIETRRSFYSRVNTSPIKIKNNQIQDDSHFYTQSDATADKTVRRENQFPELNNTINSFSKFDGKENDFFSPNLNSLYTATTNRFTSNLNARNQVKQLISEGKINESKPSLNMVESRNNLIAFSKTKKYEIEKIELIEREKEKALALEKERARQKELEKEKSENNKLEDSLNESNENNMSNKENSYSDEVKEESEEDSFAMKIKKQISNLPVPIEKKDDEGFKLLKMKEMKKKSLPPNKSAKAYDADLLPAHQKEMINGNYIKYLSI